MLISLGWLLSHHTGRIIPAHDQRDRCSDHETARTLLTLTASHQPVYVEAQTVSSSAAGTLIAGEPTYIWSRIVTSHGPPPSVTDSIFGVILENGSTVIPVPRPANITQFADVRAVPDRSGRWDVVFFELAPGSRYPHTPPVVRIWHGVVDRAGWRSLEPLPMPDSGRVIAPSASDLVRFGDDLILAVPLSMGPVDMTTLVLERKNGRWTAQPIDAPLTAATVAAVDDRGEPRIGVVRSAAVRGYDSNSLFIYSYKSRWETTDRLIKGATKAVSRPGDSAPVYEPHVAWWDTRLTAIWQAPVRDGSTDQWEGRVYVGADTAHGVIGTLLDSTTADVDQALLPRVGPVWIVSHVVDGHTSNQHFELRLYRGGGGVPELLSTAPNPFDGYTKSVVLSDTTLQIIGPVSNRTGTGPVVQSLALTYIIHCAAPDPSGTKQKQ